mgnify:CR=1 FL=1
MMAASLMRMVLMVAILFGAVVSPSLATDREALLTQSGVYGTFAAFQMDHDWWDLTGEARVIAVSEVKGLIEQFSHKIVIESYLLRGLSDHADLMFRIHAHALSDTQQFLTSLLGTRLGRHLVATTYLHGLTKPAAYAAGFPEPMKKALQAPAICTAMTSRPSGISSTIELRSFRSLALSNEALRNCPLWYEIFFTRPATGARLTCTLKTFMKIEMRSARP